MTIAVKKEKNIILVFFSGEGRLSYHNVIRFIEPLDTFRTHDRDPQCNLGSMSRLIPLDTPSYDNDPSIETNEPLKALSKERGRI